MATQKEILTERLSRQTKEREDFLQSIQPINFKSDFVTCKGCNSKIQKQYFKGLKCPLCGAVYISKTNEDRLKSFDDRIKTTKKNLADLEKSNKGKEVKKKSVVEKGKKPSKTIQEAFNAFINKYIAFGEHTDKGFITYFYTGNHLHQVKSFDVTAYDELMNLVGDSSLMDLIRGYKNKAVERGNYKYHLKYAGPYGSGCDDDFYGVVYADIANLIAESYSHFDTIDKTKKRTEFFIKIPSTIVQYKEIPNIYKTDEVVYKVATNVMYKTNNNSKEPVTAVTVTWTSLGLPQDKTESLYLKILKQNPKLLISVLKIKQIYLSEKDIVQAIKNSNYDVNRQKELCRDLSEKYTKNVVIATTLIKTYPHSFASMVKSTAEAHDITYAKLLHMMEVVSDDMLLKLVTIDKSVYDLLPIERKEKIFKMYNGS